MWVFAMLAASASSFGALVMCTICCCRCRCGVCKKCHQSRTVALPQLATSSPTSIVLALASCYAVSYVGQVRCKSVETSCKFFASIYLKILFILAHTRCEMGTDIYMYVLAYMYIYRMHSWGSCGRVYLHLINAIARTRREFIETSHGIFQRLK